MGDSIAQTLLHLFSYQLLQTNNKSFRAECMYIKEYYN